MRTTIRPDALTDGGLLALAIIWGVNFSVIKIGLAEIEPLAFNALRFPLACLVLGGALRLGRESVRPTREDLPALVGLGILGNVVYQWFFIIGIDTTLAGNASVILATVPVWTALISMRLGHERPGVTVWLGVVGTLLGMVLVAVGSASSMALGQRTLRGDVLMIGAAVSWAVYTVGSRRLVVRYGALPVTAWTMWIGTVGLVLTGLPALLRTRVETVGWMAWGSVVYAGVFALAVAYVAWYRGVQRLGSSRTAVYSNLVPVVAIVVAWLWLGEELRALQILGACIVLASLTLTRLSPRRGGRPLEPA